MDRTDLDAILHLAGIKPLGVWETLNGYSKSREDPWYLVQTPWGMLHMGWRKRVMEIDWTQTTIRVEITQDDTTKDPCYVHAWSKARAAVYLRDWRLFAEQSTAKALRDAAEKAEGGAPVIQC